ncbi:MAG: YdcF family protein [Candidatus Woesearchaeota archaeon]
MLKKIYVILTGEDEIKRPRSKKLLQLIRFHNLRDDEYKIIASGYSNFILDVDESESYKLSQYLISKGVNKDNIILEEDSMDSLGNMYFSVQKIKELLNEVDNNSPLTICLVTEQFHMKRAEAFFKLFTPFLLSTHPNITFEYQEAKSFGISKYFWRRRVKLLSKKLLPLIFKGENRIKDGEFKSILSNLTPLMKRSISEKLGYLFIVTDIEKFKLQTYNDFTDYLFSLPFYRDKFNHKPDSKFSSSVYAKIILIKPSNNYYRQK